MDGLVNSIKASINPIISLKYLTIKTKLTHNETFTCSPKNTIEEETICESKEINSTLFSDLLNHLPFEALEMADITYLLDKFKELNHSSHTPGWGGYKSHTTHKFYTNFEDIGILTLSYNRSHYDEFGSIEEENYIEINIPNVVYKNHKYYFLSVLLENWLNVEGNVKRNRILKQLNFE
jgi:hypothetical protein